MSKIAPVARAALFLAFALETALARADTPPVPTAAPPARAERVQLKYLAGGGCPSEAAFNREVKARIRRVVVWVEADPSKLVNVRVELRGGRARGSLELVDATGEPTLRTFDADTCAEVASALALVVALALDPNASTEPLLPEPEPPPAPARATPASVAPPPTPAEPARKLHFTFGPALALSSGYAPVALVAAGGALGARYDSEGAFAPALQLTPLYGKTGALGARYAPADFSALLLRVDACPVALRAGKLMRFMPCLSADLGRMQVASRAPGIDAMPQGVFWADLGLSARARAVSEPLFIELAASGLAPLTRPSYVVDYSSGKQSLVYRPGSLLASGMLSFGVEL